MSNNTENAQLINGICIAAGAVIAKCLDWFINLFTKKVDINVNLSNQLWAEIHELRERYDSQEEKCYKRIDDLQKKVVELQEKIDKLEIENMKLMKQLLAIAKISPAEKDGQNV